MYKILIKKPTMPKDCYGLYTETVTDIEEDSDKVTKTTIIYETDNLDELSEKYKELLKIYTTSQILLIDELDIELIANITDSTN